VYQLVVRFQTVEDPATRATAESASFAPQLAATDSCGTIQSSSCPAYPSISRGPQRYLAAAAIYPFEVWRFVAG